MPIFVNRKKWNSLHIIIHYPALNWIFFIYCDLLTYSMYTVNYLVFRWWWSILSWMCSGAFWPSGPDILDSMWPSTLCSDGGDLSWAECVLVYSDQVDQTFWILCHLHGPSHENMEVRDINNVISFTSHRFLWYGLLKKIYWNLFLKCRVSWDLINFIWPSYWLVLIF